MPQPTVQSTAPTIPTAVPTNFEPQGWKSLYVRAGFTGAAAVDVRAVGDVSLARHVAPVVRAHPSGWLFESVAPLLAGDVVLGNLESPLTSRRDDSALRPGPYRLPADPMLVDRLAPFTALSLANNHALDAGPDGLADAHTTLTNHGITALGVAGSCAPDETFSTTTTPRLHVLAFNAVHDPQDQPDEVAGCGRAWLDDDALTHITMLRRTTGEPIVVLVHWGIEYATTPTDEQRTWAQRLVAAGADLIVGAHPHVVQPAQVLAAGGRRGFVAYSLGNFVFDQPNDSATSHSIVLRAWIDDQGVGAVAIAPVVIVNGQPQPLPLDDPAALATLATATNDQRPITNEAGRTTTELATPEAVVPDTRVSSGGPTHAWRWNGTTFAPVAVPEGTMLPPSPQQLEVDLRGDGVPLHATLGDGVVQVRDETHVVWQNEAITWNVTGMDAGDVDNDGRFELLLRLWKPDADGVMRSHPFLVGWRGGYYRVFWGGSAVARPIRDAAIGPVSGPRNLLVVLDGGTTPDDPANRVAVFAFQDWQFVEQWHSGPGRYEQLVLLDLDGDGVREIVVR